VSALRRSGSVVALRVDGRIADPRDQGFAELLRTRRFRTIENAASEEVSIGWCTPADPTGETFTVDDLDGGAGTWLRFRTDVKKLPAASLQMHRAAREKALGRRLSARERRELRDELHEHLLPRVLPRTTFVDALLFHQSGLVLLFATAKAARDSFGKLFFESLGAPLNSCGPNAIATETAWHDVLNLAPTRWPGGSGSESPADDPLAWMGEELLLWLWWSWEAEGGEFTLPGGRVVGLAIDDLVVFAPSSKEETTQTLRHGLPTRTAEARTALRSGNRPARARLLMAEGARQWSFVLDAGNLRFGGVKLPEDAEECESDADRTADRSANWLALHEIVQGLFVQFVVLRTGEKWEATRRLIAAWMGGGA